MSQEFPIAKGKNLTTIEWFNLMSCDLALEYDCKRISIHEYTARKLELLDRARQMEKERIIEFAEQYNMYLLKCKRGIRGSVVEMSAEQYYETFKI